MFKYQITVDGDHDVLGNLTIDVKDDGPQIKNESEVLTIQHDETVGVGEVEGLACREECSNFWYDIIHYSHVSYWNVYTITTRIISIIITL